MAKVDILLPYWGDVELLKKAVESVIAQTEQDWRLVVFDDCYPSAKPAQYFNTINDKRVEYKRHKQNLGITKNFNHALQAAKAEYCILMGCDDIMLPNYLERALQYIGSADFYQPGIEIINAHGSVYTPLADRIKRFIRPRRAGSHSGERLAASLCRGNWLYFPSILWKTQTIRRYGFNMRYKIVQDVELELSIIKDGGELYLDQGITFQYRRFPDSLSSKEKRKGGIRFGEEDDVYNRFAESFQAQGWKKASRSASIRMTSRLHKIIASL